MSHDHADDLELRGVAMAAFDEHERSVSGAETELALGAVRSRIAAGDPGGTSPVLAPQAVARRRSPWLVVVAAAAVIALIAGGLVAVLTDGDDGSIVPAAVPTAVEAAPEPTTPDEDPVVAPETTTVDETPTTTAPSASFVQQTISVDAANPPTGVAPVVFASIPLEPNPSGNGVVSVAVGPDGIVVKQPSADFVSVVDRADGAMTPVAIGEDISSVVAGPSDVIYGLGDPVFDEGNAAVPRGFRFVAIATSGTRSGQVVAVREVGLNEYLELPPFFFGHGPDGVIDRGRRIGTTVIEYVDEAGAALDAPTEFPIPAFSDTDGDGFRDRDVIELTGTDVSWRLDIRPDPTNSSPFVGPTPPAPTSNGRVIYFERIGPDLVPEQDFGPSAMPVVAILNPDGSGSWVRLPEDWDVVASDVWGTVLMRRTDADLEFAYLDDSLPPADSETVTTTTAAPASQPDGALAISRNCVAEYDCTQLATTEDGRIVAYDPSDDTLSVFDRSGMELQSAVAVDSDVVPLERVWFVAVGPDDIAYLSVPTPGADAANDLLAIPLLGENAGQVVLGWTGLDGSGDSTLISRRAGLTVVPCCGPRVTRPAPDSAIYRWVDSDGEVIESTAPSFDLTLGDAGSSLTRIDGAGTFTRFTLPTVFQYPRDFPTTIATDDGGALALDYLQPGGPTVLVDFNTDWPESGIDNGDVYYFEETAHFGSILLEPSGTVVVADGDSFVRRSLGEVATPGWSGIAVTDFETATVTAPGLNEHIDEHAPLWAADPELFAYQIVSWIRPNNSVTVEFDDSESPAITITTSGFLGDSVAADQRVVTTERGDDGLLRFVSGTYGIRCQPGRGHQDFSLEPCI